RHPGSHIFPYTTLFRSSANLETLSLTEKTATGFTAKRNTLEFDEELKDVLQDNLKPTMDNIETIESDNLFDKSSINVGGYFSPRSEEHTSELQSRFDLV